MNKIKFGIVGCGRIGARHAEHIFHNKRAELAFVCDILRKRADKFAQDYSSKAIYDFKDLVTQDIDVISICTPSGLHAEMSIWAMKNGKHILCEKPMALHMIDAEKMIQVEKEYGKKLFLVKQNRYNPPIKLLKDSVYNNKLGKIMLITSNVLWNRNKSYYMTDDWKGTMKLDGGALMTQCSHFLDLMIWIGGKVKSVNAKMINLDHHYIETEDTGLITLEFENGAIGCLQYTTCVYKQNLEGSISVLGTKGSIKVGGQYLNTLDFWDVEGFARPDVVDGAPLLPDANGTYKGSMSKHDEVIENVVAVLLDGAEIGTNGIHGRASVEVMQAAYISALEGKKVSLPLNGTNYIFKICEEPPISGHKKGDIDG
jgi:predicted dehydrogenase